YGAEAGGHFDWHSDIGDGLLAARRKLTIVVQLSDPADYQGGLLQTNADGHVNDATAARGSAIVFPSFVLHRVTSVTAGARYSLTTWVHGPAFR
ncbi:MAG TPA: 2OG-Fe(II) oxygenase, partial [Pararhizobium sp.]|nr:2OG-Fe(II) oxygenase [Pararhizobium sp.]